MIRLTKSFNYRIMNTKLPFVIIILVLLCLFGLGSLWFITHNQQLVSTELKTVEQPSSQENFENKQIFREDEHIILHVDYPYTSHTLLDKSIRTFIDEQIRIFETDIKGFDDDFELPYKYSLYISYKVIETPFDIMSIQFSLSSYYGGAHPTSYAETFVYDHRQEKILTLHDLFNVDYLTALAELSFETLRADLQKQNVEIDISWLAEGTDSIPDNYQFFVLTQQGLTFIFPAYQVAPYALGQQEVLLPYSKIQHLLVPLYKQRFNL